MDRRRLIEEFNGILVWLRDHSHLKYSGNPEDYEDRVKTAAGEFTALLRRETGVKLPQDASMVPSLDDARGASLDVMRGLAGRTSRKYRRAANEAAADSPRRAFCERSAELWEQARDRL